MEITGLDSALYDLFIVIVTALIGFLFYFFKGLIVKYSDKLGHEESDALINLLKSAAYNAVLTSEQAFGSKRDGKLSSSVSIEMKDYATGVAKKFLGNNIPKLEKIYGDKVNEVIQHTIESVLYELKQGNMIPNSNNFEVDKIAEEYLDSTGVTTDKCGDNCDCKEPKTKKRVKKEI